MTVLCAYAVHILNFLDTFGHYWLGFEYPFWRVGWIHANPVVFLVHRKHACIFDSLENSYLSFLYNRWLVKNDGHLNTFKGAILSTPSSASKPLWKLGLCLTSTCVVNCILCYGTEISFSETHQWKGFLSFLLFFCYASLASILKSTM